MAKIFVSYSHHDRRWVDSRDQHNLIPFLADSLRRDGVEIWADPSMVPGDEFRKEIEARIEQADLAILLVSQHFLNSAFINDVELPRIEARANAGDLRVMPILVGHCDWQQLGLVGNRHVLPGGPTPLIEYIDKEAAWQRVQQEILRAVRTQLARKPSVMQVPRREAGEAEKPVEPPVSLSVRAGAPRPSRQSIDLTPEDRVVELARAIHEEYRELGRLQGWLLPAEDIDFDELPESVQAANRGAAERLSYVLGLINLGLEPGSATAAEEARVHAELVYSLEVLAEAEHDGWVGWHSARGWRLGEVHDAQQRLHPRLRPYNKLSESERNRDRTVIKRYPAFARRAGLKIVRI